jgi:hypothetical protein
MAPFRWQICFTDALATWHDKTIRSCLDEVIALALRYLDRRMKELALLRTVP